MLEKHLTIDNAEQYVENTPNEQGRAQIEEHLAMCAPCRARVVRARRMDAALRALPRTKPAQELTARISAAAELRVVQDQSRRMRMPFIAAAMFFSMLLVLWFGFEMILALDDNGALYLLSLFATQPDVLSTYSFDAVFAFVELLPLSEIILTLFALLTVVVLAQQLLDTLQPRTV